MSIGIGGRANKILEDNKTVIFEYGGYDLNKSSSCISNAIFDGMITIPKQCFVEPEIHKKLKRMPNGRKKLVVKRIPVDVDCEEMIKSGLVKVENCSTCRQITKAGIDITALRLLRYIFIQYQAEGSIPEAVSYHV